MAEDVDPLAHNRVAWDALVDSNNEWSLPVGAREGDWSVVVIGHEPTPRDWLPSDLTGVRVLCKPPLHE